MKQFLHQMQKTITMVFVQKNQTLKMFHQFGINPKTAFWHAMGSVKLYLYVCLLYDNKYLATMRSINFGIQQVPFLITENAL